MVERDDSEIDWDEVVDVVCVGSSPGVLAYAICCAENDLDVLIVHPPAQLDAETTHWFAEMTGDLAPGLNSGLENPAADREGFSFARVAPSPVKLEPFVGERLRQWSAYCVRSPFGVMFTQVPELLLPMRTADDESITAALVGNLGDGAGDLATWLADRAWEIGLAEPENRMAAMVVDGGAVAGVELDDGYRVGACGGLVWPVGAAAARADLPSHGGCTVALVGRPAGRFATVELLRP